MASSLVYLIGLDGLAWKPYFPLLVSGSLHVEK